MFILTIRRLSERFDNNDCASEWKYDTSVVPFATKTEARAYLKRLKTVYHGEGKPADGSITGQKFTRQTGASTLEHIRTMLVECEYGKELVIDTESDAGASPYHKP